MAKVPFRGFVGGAYKAASWKASAQRCINLYPEDDPEKGLVLYGTPGQSQLSTVGNAPILAMEATPSGLLIVTGDGAYWATGIENGVLLGLSQILVANSPYAVIAQAGDQLMFVNGDAGFAINRVTQTYTQITSPGFPPSPRSCAAVDGYFIVHGTDTDQFFWSEPFNPAVWDATEFAVAENMNDKLQRAITMERELYLIGATSTEIWANVGGVDVFDRIQGTFVPYGTSAPLSAATIGQSLFFLSQDQNGGAVVVRVRGLQSARVSTHALESELRTYPTLVDAYALVYQQRGHQFYCLTFPTAGKTWVLDLSTELWHERSSQVPDPFSPDQTAPISRVPGAWLPRCHAYFAEQNLVGDRLSNVVSILSENTPSERGVDIVRVRSSPHVTKNMDEFTIAMIEVDFQPGVGNGTGLGPGNNPEAMLRISRDGGKTFGPSRRVSIGRQGEYLARARWNRCGRSRDFVAEVSFSAPVSVAISGAYLDLTP